MHEVILVHHDGSVAPDGLKWLRSEFTYASIGDVEHEGDFPRVYVTMDGGSITEVDVRHHGTSAYDESDFARSTYALVPQDRKGTDNALLYFDIRIDGRA